MLVEYKEFHLLKIGVTIAPNKILRHHFFYGPLF